MSLSIRLLGRPSIERDGRPVEAPRGQKGWALLSYLVLSERPVPRRELAELLFSEADDPLGALRWSVSQIRRAIGPEAEIGGDPLRLTLNPEASIDVAMLLAGTALERGDEARLTQELLDGMSVERAPAFETWLSVERRRLSAAAEGALQESALVSLAAGEHTEAVELARRAAVLNPLDEANQELLVRCLAASGDRKGALAQVEACAELFGSELGLEPSAAVRNAADYPEPGARRQGRPAAARGLLEAGRAAISAGATEAGVTSLREACAEAARARDPLLRAETLCALGIALVHVVRGWDGEGAASLHRSLVLAEQEGARGLMVTAHRELGWIGAMSGRGDQADAHLRQANELASEDAEIAAILGVQGMRVSDTGDYGHADELLNDSIERARRAADRRQSVFSGAMLARTKLLTGELGAAESLADEAIAEAQELRWIAYQPFPETTRAEVDRLRGALDQAEERFDHAFAVGCQLGDPCWEGFAARGLGLVTAQRGEPDGGRRWLEEARTRCVRWPDIYAWALAYVLDAETGLATERGDPGALEMAEQLQDIATRAGLRELVARSLLHQARLGRSEAAAGAELIGGELDSPVLHEDLRRVTAPAQPS